MISHKLLTGLSFLLFFLLVLTQKAAWAQELQFERLSVEQGLSQATVNCFLQDRQGFVWIGTNDGLNRFDGYRFLHYRHYPGDSASISNNAITAMGEGHDGTLWIDTNGGLNQFDRETETFRHIRHDANNPQSLDDNRVRVIFEDRAGIL